MNKLYVSLSIVAAFAISNKGLAQTTITSTVMPQVGYTYDFSADTLPADMPAFLPISAGSGTAQTWDYSQTFANTYAAPMSFVTPTGNPGASSFPNATLASDQGGGNWAYFKTGSSGLVIDGVNANIQGTAAQLDFTPDEIVIPTPFTLNGIVNNTYSATTNVTVSGFPATVNHRANRTITADAFGTLITPVATYSNVLRIKTYEITSDTAFVFGTAAYEAYDTTTTYNWVQNTTDALVMEIDINHSGAVTSAKYLQNFSNGINVVKHAEFATNLYPNPASSISYLSYENTTASKVDVSIFDVTGRLITKLVSNQQQTAGIQIMPIDITSMQLPHGLYMVQLTINGATKTLKLNVQ